jgi:hypothetical protein
MLRSSATCLRQANAGTCLQWVENPLLANGEKQGVGLRTFRYRPIIRAGSITTRDEYEAA